MSYHGLGADVIQPGVVDAWGFIGEAGDPCPQFHVMRDGRCLTAADLNFNPAGAKDILDNIAKTNAAYQVNPGAVTAGARVADVAVAPIVTSSNSATAQTGGASVQSMIHSAGASASQAVGFSIPWWGWAAAAGAAFFIFGRGR